MNGEGGFASAVPPFVFDNGETGGTTPVRHGMLARNRFFRPLLWPTVATAAMFALLVGLGVWQLQRLDWKLALIAKIDERMSAPAADAPPEASWPALDVAALEYRHLRLTGTFRHDSEFHYFTQADRGTPGYDIITPLLLSSGGIVLVDRGFVPEERKDQATREAGQIAGEVTVVGIVRMPQRRDTFTPPDDIERNLWFTRDPQAMAAASHLGPVAPFFVEADATPNPGGLPKGGRTHVDIRNEHLQYALTWFSLAGALLVIYFFYHRGRGRVGRPKA